MNDFATIGFTTDQNWDINEFKKTLGLAAEKGEWIKALVDGYYIKLSGESGEEIWAQANPDKELIGGHPHFSGQSRNIFLYQTYSNEKYSPLDASIYSHIQPGDSETDYPLFIDCPDFFLHKQRKEGEKVVLQITAFAKKDIEVFDDYESYKEVHQNHLAERALIPVGTFNPDGSEKIPTAHALFIGNILEVKQVKNSFTGIEFYYLLVRTLSAEYDVVVGLDCIKKAPEVGNLITGIFWMSGRIVEPE